MSKRLVSPNIREIRISANTQRLVKFNNFRVELSRTSALELENGKTQCRTALHRLNAMRSKRSLRVQIGVRSWCENQYERQLKGTPFVLHKAGGASSAPVPVPPVLGCPTVCHTHFARTSMAHIKRTR